MSSQGEYMYNPPLGAPPHMGHSPNPSTQELPSQSYAYVPPTLQQPQPTAPVTGYAHGGLYADGLQQPQGNVSDYASSQFAGSSRISRTPSPTPSETQAIKQSGFFDWSKLKNPKGLSWKDILFLVILVLVLVGTILFAVFEKQIITAFLPAAKWTKGHKGGFLIPIFLIIIMSFPPLFGQELVAIMCGLIYGVGIGFAVVAVGTLVGETLQFVVFKYVLRERGARYEKKSIFFGSLCQVVREGGFKIVLIARYSAIPAHFTTAVFAACQLNLMTFLIAAVLALPKQLATVLIGYEFLLAAESKETKASKIATTVVTIVTILVTIFAMKYMAPRIKTAKIDIVYQRRKARQGEQGFASPRNSGEMRLLPGSSAAYAPV